MAEANLVHFAPDGSHVAVFARSSGPGGEVFVYDSNGDKLFQKEGSPVTFSADGKKLFYLNHGGVSACGLDGRVIWTSTTPFQPEVFSADGKLMLARNGPALYEVRVADGHVIWKWEGRWHYQMEPDEHGSLIQTNNVDFGISYAAISSNAEIISAIGTTSGFEYLDASKASHRFTIKESDLFVIDGHTGKLLGHKILDRHQFMALGSLTISQDGHLVVIQGKPGLLYFSVYPRSLR